MLKVVVGSFNWCDSVIVLKHLEKRANKPGGDHMGGKYITKRVEGKEYHKLFLLHLSCTYLR